MLNYPTCMFIMQGQTAWIFLFFFFLVICRALSGASSDINYVQGCCEAHRVRLKQIKTAKIRCLCISPCKSSNTPSSVLICFLETSFSLSLPFYFMYYGFRGGSRISGKVVHMYKGVCVWGGGRFVDLIAFFLKYPMKMKKIWSH